MIIFVSQLSGSIYRSVVKPIAFKVSPDRVHSDMLRLGAWLQKNRVVRRLLRTTYAYEDLPVLKQTIHDIVFTNPIGLSAGFDKNIELPRILHSIGFGFMEGGTVTNQFGPGNPRPWFYRLPHTKSLVVHAGLGNQGADQVMARLKKYPKDTFTNFPLNVSIAHTNIPSVHTEAGMIADCIRGLRKVKQTAVAAMITINISCPNTYGGEPFTQAQSLDRLLTAVDKVKLAQPIFLKMPSDLTWKQFDDLLQVAARHTVSGITICNLTKDRAKITFLEELPDYVKGGLSGKPTYELSNRLIKETYTHYGKRFTIIGVGGVFSAQDAYTKIRLGASLVELITGMIFQGPQLIGQINRELARLVRADGFSSIYDAIGVDA